MTKSISGESSWKARQKVKWIGDGFSPQTNAPGPNASALLATADTLRRHEPSCGPSWQATCRLKRTSLYSGTQEKKSHPSAALMPGRLNSTFRIRATWRCWRLRADVRSASTWSRFENRPIERPLRGDSFPSMNSGSWHRLRPGNGARDFSAAGRERKLTSRPQGTGFRCRCISLTFLWSQGRNPHCWRRVPIPAKQRNGRCARWKQVWATPQRSACEDRDGG